MPKMGKDTDFSFNDSGIRVPKYNPENWEFKISSVPMLRMIWKTCEWDTEKTYRLTGICHSEYNLVEFDMKQATVLTVEEF